MKKIKLVFIRRENLINKDNDFSGKFQIIDI